MTGICLWITGLPGSGKSTVAEEVKKVCPEFIMLRMDVFRKFVTPEPIYSEAERDMVYRALVYLAKELTGLGHNVIIDATGNLRKWRELARRETEKFMEIYLRCPLEVCIGREENRAEKKDAPPDIYKKGASGWSVPGLSAPYEEPLNPEIIADTDRESIKEITDRVVKRIATLKPG